MEGVGHERLRIQQVSPYSFSHRHEEVDIKANSRDADTSICFVSGSEVGIVMRMAMGVAVTAMMPVLGERRHGYGRRWPLQADSGVVEAREASVRVICCFRRMAQNYRLEQGEVETQGGLGPEWGSSPRESQGRSGGLKRSAGEAAFWMEQESGQALRQRHGLCRLKKHSSSICSR